MTIYVDQLFESWKPGKLSGEWCHLWSSDGSRELDEFAHQIGMKLHWAQTSNSVFLGKFYHYDLRPSMRKLAILHGAVEIELQDYLKRFIQNGSEKGQS